MGRYCEAATCWSHDNKRKNLQIYPWMRDVTWDLGEIPNKLYKFDITAHSRLCSHHFDKEQLQNDGHAMGFPKYFYWNNYMHGLVLNPRKSGAVEKRAQAEAAVASPPAASPEAEPDAALGNAMRTHARRVIVQAPEVGQSRK